MGIGPAYRLKLDDDILGGTIMSGSPFAVQVKLTCLKSEAIVGHCSNSPFSATAVKTLLWPTVY